MPVLPLVHSTPIVGTRSNVENYKPHPTEADDLKNAIIK